MQSAETVLSVLRERGRRGLPLDEIYRQLFNPALYLLAYGRIYSNKGAMTPGATPETADGMSMGKIGRIIEAMRYERYRFSPARRIYIPKKNGKMRPLGLPTWSDKLVGEVIRLLLEAYYEPTFSDRSHGFRPKKGCHTALREVASGWKGTTWFIEADVVDCFGSLDHEVMLSTIGQNIHDGRFLALLRHMLTAGYLEDWVWNATLSGAPQGGVVSPVLSNIYLNRLDQFVDTVLIPDYTRGEIRAPNLAYVRVKNRLRAAHKRGDRVETRRLRQQSRDMSSKDPTDPGFRRLRYIRYADDQLLGFTGPKAEAEEIKTRLAEFLRDDLALELSPEKTLITHARTRAARFLGYDIITQKGTRRIVKGRRAANATIGLRVPTDVIKAKAAPYLKGGKPAYRSEWINEDDHTIVATYGSIYRGIVQYYLPAGDVYRLHRLEWVMKTSMLKTLAAKHDSTVSKMATKHQAKITTPHGPRRCFEARIERKEKAALVSRFGGIPLKREKWAVLTDRRPAREPYPRKELVTRLLNGRCELCTSTDDIYVHQVARLADLAKPGPPTEWIRIMAKRRRKTLVVCRTCYDTIRSATPRTSTQ
jgi:group II intron reverse transcriptase/maturase